MKAKNLMKAKDNNVLNDKIIADLNLGRSKKEGLVKKVFTIIIILAVFMVFLGSRVFASGDPFASINDVAKDLIDSFQGLIVQVGALAVIGAGLYQKFVQGALNYRALLGIVVGVVVLYIVPEAFQFIADTIK